MVLDRVTSGPRTATFKVALRTSTTLGTALAVIGLAVGGLVGLGESDIETATASVLVNPLDGNPFSTSGSGDNLINMVSEAELVKSDAVAGLVRKDLSSVGSNAEALGGLSVDVPPNSQIVQITYETRQKGQAALRAQAFAEDYLDYRRSRAEGLVTSQSDQVQRQIVTATEEQAALAARLAELRTGSAEASVAQTQLDAVTVQLNQLRGRASDVTLMPTNPGQVVTPAEVRPRGVLGSWIAYPAAGMIGGLLIALGVAVLRARLDNHIHHPDDIAILGHSLLGQVTWAESEQAVSALRGDAGREPTDGYRRLRVRLLTAEPRRPVVILIASGTGSGAGPVTAAPLLLTLAASRIETVLVDTVGTLDGLGSAGASSAAGLADVLADDGNPEAALQHVVPYGSVLHRGRSLGKDDLFMTHQMDHLMSALRKEAEVVIVTGGGIHESHTLALASACDVVVLEVVAGESTFTDLARASDDLSGITDKVLGVVLVEQQIDKGSAGPRGRFFRRRPSPGAAAVPGTTTDAPEPLPVRPATDAAPDGHLGENEAADATDDAGPVDTPSVTKPGRKARRRR